MLTQDDLLVQNTIPLIRDVSLKLYKDFSENVLLKRKFHYYFSDDSDIFIEFREWGIYHMLAMQHINYRIDNDSFFDAIDNGLDLSTFRTDTGMNNRFKSYKTRIASFSCIYTSLLNGTAFYLPSEKVKNTANVKSDYILYNNIDEKGINYGLQLNNNVLIPVTTLIAKKKDPIIYLEDSTFKLIQKVDVLDSTGSIIESKVHNTQTNPLVEQST